MVAKPEVQTLSPEPLPVLSKRMTWEQFLNWDGEDLPDEWVYADWVDGEIMLINAPGDEHQQIAVFMTTIMAAYASVRKAGTVRAAPFLVHLANSGRHPDVMFIAADRLSIIQPQYVEGAPDIVVEVLSPSTRDTDEQTKFKEYETAGVREYWLLDYERQEAKFYRLGADKTFSPVEMEDGVFSSEALPGFRLNVSWLWDDPLSRIPEALREIGAI